MKLSKRKPQDRYESQTLTSPEEKVIETNAALTSLGKWNKLRIIAYLLMGIIKALTSLLTMLTFLFYGAAPTEQRCRIPQNSTVNESIPVLFERGKMQLSQCYQFVNFSMETNQTEPCTNGYEYGYSVVGHTYVMEWDLVCDRGWVAEFASSAYFAASFIGALLFANLVDKYGRKPLFLILLLLLNLTALGHAFVPNIWVFTALRLVEGAFQQGMYVAGYCFVVEFFPVEMRSMIGILDQCCWVFACVLMSGICYLVRDWRMYYIIVSVPFVLCVPLLWLMPETVPWLVAKNRQKEARKVLKRVCALERDVDPKMFDNVRIVHSAVEEEKNEDRVNYTMVDLFRNNRLFLFISIQMFQWFVTCILFYGMAISVVRTSNPYTAFALSSLVELPAYVVSAPLSGKLGRRTLCVIYGMMASSCYAAAYFVREWETAKIVILLIGRFGDAGMFAIIFLYVTEIFPTTLRTTATGLASGAARIGATCAPFILYIDRVVPWGSAAALVPLGFVGSLLMLLLPETVHRKLPEKIEELEEWRRTDVLCRLYGGRHGDRDADGDVEDDGLDDTAGADDIIFRKT